MNQIIFIHAASDSLFVDFVVSLSRVSTVSNHEEKKVQSSEFPNFEFRKFEIFSNIEVSTFRVTRDHLYSVPSILKFPKFERNNTRYNYFSPAICTKC